jgi:CubicO group peptidase (beta-lactamase class C family)
MLQQPPSFEPGSRFEYSNAGYAAGGALLESAAGDPWETLIQEKILEPLGMRSAGFGAPGSAKRSPDQPWGHDSEGKPVAPGPLADNPVAIAPAGAIHCSLLDFAVFAIMHCDRKTGQVLKQPKSFEKLHTPVRDGYAMGWLVAERPWAEGEALTHTGSNTMFTTTIWIAPKRRFAVMVATNIGQDVAAKGVDETVGALIQQYLE